jgi:hypothetical protein
MEGAMLKGICKKFAGTWRLGARTLDVCGVLLKDPMYVEAKEFIIIDIEKKVLFEFQKYPVPLFPTLPRLHPVSATRRQAEIVCKFYRTFAWWQVAETGCKWGTSENKGTGFGASLHPLGGDRVWRTRTCFGQFVQTTWEPCVYGDQVKIRARILGPSCTPLDPTHGLAGSADSLFENVIASQGKMADAMGFSVVRTILWFVHQLFVVFKKKWEAKPTSSICCRKEC